MKAKAKELIADGKEKEARKILEEATKIKKQLDVLIMWYQNVQTRRKLIENKKFEIETHQMNV